jgi:hypothetical protein
VTVSRKIWALHLGLVRPTRCEPIAGALARAPARFSIGTRPAGGDVLDGIYEGGVRVLLLPPPVAWPIHGVIVRIGKPFDLGQEQDADNSEDKPDENPYVPTGT